MARIKIELPQEFDFSTEIPLRISDINYGGHLGHDSVVSLTHEARVRFLREYGYSELNIEGWGLIVSDLVVIYRSEAFYGETVKIDIAVCDFNKYGCDLVYRITDKETQREIARAKTGIVFFDYATKKVVNVPEKFKSLFTSKGEYKITIV
ncbi:MAG: thioesterase [Deltaproteobacteria bacterium]|jgi:acyl-CoA thioester hydrolase|nr:MAG: thioesterase [Deltaproteobacteria bacterium]